MLRFNAAADRVASAMESKQMILKTWYTTPAMNSRTTSPLSLQRSGTVSSAVAVSSTPAASMSLPPAVSSAVSVSLPHSTQMSVQPSGAVLPGVASFLPRYKRPNALTLVISARKPSSGSQITMPMPDGRAVVSKMSTGTSGNGSYSMMMPVSGSKVIGSKPSIGTPSSGLENLTPVSSGRVKVSRPSIEIPSSGSQIITLMSDNRAKAPNLSTETPNNDAQIISTGLPSSGSHVIITGTPSSGSHIIPLMSDSTVKVPQTITGTPSSGIDSMMCASDTGVRDSKPAICSHTVSLLSSGPSPHPSEHLRSASSSRDVWPVMQAAAPRHASSVSSTGGMYWPVTMPSAGAVSDEDAVGTASTLQQTSPGFFRPVGILLKKNQSASTSPSSHVEGQTAATDSAYLYCSPPAHLPWTPNGKCDNWSTTNTSYDRWIYENKFQHDSKGQVCSNSLMFSDSTLQTNYGMNQFSQVYMSNQNYSNNGQEAGCENGIVFQEEMPSASAFDGSHGLPALYDARNDLHSMPYADEADSGVKAIPYPTTRQEYVDCSVKTIPYANTTVGCVTRNDSVVTVRAHDTSMFMASPAGTTSQTESEFSLHDAKMQLAEPSLSGSPAPPPSYSSPSALSCKGMVDKLQPQPSPAPPSSPYGSVSAMSCGGVVDKLQPHPTPGDEVKPHPGLDMLSDVSLLVESLTSQGSSSCSKDSPCVASSSTVASGLMNSGSYPPVDTNMALCAPQATYIGNLPPDPDSTFLHSTDHQVDSAILPEGDLEYTTMNPAPVMPDVCGTRMEDLQDQYTLMLPPKKSTKFTKGPPQTDPQSIHSTESSHKPRLFLKLSNSIMDSTSTRPKQRGRPRKERNLQDDGRSTPDCGSRKRGRPRKVKDSMENSESKKSAQHFQITHKDAKIENSKSTNQTQFSRENKYIAKGGENVDHVKESGPVIADQKTVNGVSNDTEARQMTTDHGLMGCVSQNNYSLIQLTGSRGDGPGYPVCKSEGLENGMPRNAQASATAVLEASAVPSEDENHECSQPGNLPIDVMDDDEFSCPKVHFDPLVIAEEEVTSTQPHDSIPQSGNTDISTEDCGRVKKTKSTKSRRRSHLCVSCYTIPSSCEETFSSNSASPMSSIPKSTALTSSKGRSRKFSADSCKRCRHVKSNPFNPACDLCDSPSTKESAKSADTADPNLFCEVCCRTFSSSGNVKRHQLLFHPSIFMPDTHIMELPLATHQRHRSAATAASVSFASSVPSADTAPVSPTLTMRSVNAGLPSPPSSSIQSGKSTPTPYNSPAYPPSVDSGTIGPADGLVKGTTAGGKNRPQADQADPTQTEHIPKKRRRRQKAKDQNQKDWKLATKPLKLKKKGQSGRRRHQKTSGQDTKNCKRRPTTITVHRPQKTLASRHRLLRCSLNFRTKKRTRVNSTIPCPYCHAMFSVMSNLKRHTKQRHHDVNVFVCNVCSLKVNMRRKLNKHMRLCHAETFPHACTNCLARFRSEEEMEAHGRVHEISRFPCDDCSLVFYTEEHLGDHMAQYHVTIDVSE